jgi:DUF3043 family protein
VFRRRQSATADAPVQDATGSAAADGQTGPASGDGAATGHAITAGKGRPTPKRSEAERRRRQPYTAPSDRKEANRQYRAREREARNRKLQGMQRGEQWALPPRDRGPAKALARDYVDSRRRVSEFYMYGLLVMLVLLFVPNPLIKGIVPLVVIAFILIMLVEGIFIGYRVRSLSQQRLPGESTRGVRMYAAMRALQIRRLRVPKPRIKPGESF